MILLRCVSDALETLHCCDASVTQFGGNKLSKDCTQQKLKIYGDHSLPEIINSFGIDFNVADVSVVVAVVADDVVVAVVIGWIWDFSSTFPTSYATTGNRTHVS